MPTAAEYKEYADECLQAARLTVSPEVRATLMAMAEKWNKLAANEERNAHLRAKPRG